MPATIPPQRQGLGRICWESAGCPCTVSGPPGDLARYMQAEAADLITCGDLADVVGNLVVIPPHVIESRRVA